METNQKKNKIIKVLLSVFVLLLIIIGLSYAVWTYSFTGGVNTISSQEVSIDLLESNSEIINITNAIPMTDEEGLAQTDSFAFAVTSKMSQEKVINYIVSMQKLTPDTGYTFLNDNKIKIYIEDFDGNEVLEPTLVSDLNNYELTKGFHDHDSSHVEVQNKYRLKVWIDQSAESSYDWSTSLNLQYKFKLGVTAEDQQTVKHTVNVVVNNGTVTPSTKQVVDGDRAQFTLTPTNSTSDAVVSCTNSQTGTIKNNTLTVSNVTNNTTCTVTFSPASTVLYTDGTLIINEKTSDRSANITTHGAVTTEYTPLSNQNTYVFTSNTSQPWNSKKTSVTSVEIGQHIEPTDTKYWFYGLTNMSAGNLTNLDTKNATNMQSMFYRAGYNSSVTSFALTGLNNWDTSNVTDMSSMFLNAANYATTFNLDLSNWDTSKVTNMSYMLYYVGYRAITWSAGDLSNWDVSNVIDMSAMLGSTGYNATTFDIGDISGWDTSKVTSMRSMFYYAGYSATTFDIGDLSNWDTSKVTNMAGMFSYAGWSATTWNIGDLSNWYTSKVTDMSHMFNRAGYNATTFNLGDLSNWYTSNVTNMSYMFDTVGRSATTWNIGDLSSWDTSSVTNMSYMFDAAGYSAATWNIGSLSNWDVSRVTDMSYMFNAAGYSSTTWSIGDLSNWDTSSVTTMQSMFSNAGYNATTWDSIGTLKIYATNIYQMFNRCSEARVTLNIYSNPASGTSGYNQAFYDAATDSSALITVNYSSATTRIDNIIATKSSNSNVVKGSLLS